MLFNRLRSVAYCSISLVMLASCARSSTEREWLRTAVQRAQRFGVGVDTVAVVVFDPATCLACDRDLTEWVKARRRAPGYVVLFLTNEPGRATQANFVAQRISIDGVLSAPQRARLASVPAEYLLSSGEVIASRHRAGPTHRADLIDAYRHRLGNR